MGGVLITGASGCIGSATVAWLRAQGADDIVGLTRSGQADGLDCIAADVSDAVAVDRAIRKTAPSQVIHLAAFQTPDCQAQPLRGMEINV